MPRLSDRNPLYARTRTGARYIVELAFADPGERVIDLEALLWGPMFEPPVADYALRQVWVGPDAGTIVWANCADISPRRLFAFIETLRPRPEGLLLRPARSI